VHCVDTFSVLINCSHQKHIFMFLRFTKSSLLIIIAMLSFIACKKTDAIRECLEHGKECKEGKGHLKQTKSFSSDVVIKWLNMELNMFRLPLATGTSAPSADRALAYAGIALYESVVPGMPAHRSLGGQLNQFPAMPSTQPGMAYHWAASANAALAAINRSLFTGTAPANKVMMEQLENELQQQYATEVDAQTLQRSIEFGRAVAAAVFNWSQGDGTASMPSPSTYVIPVGAGLWEKTPPNFAGPVNAFHSMRRLMVIGSSDGAKPPAPVPYSTNPSSEFYAMAKEVYDISQALTPEQKNIAMYHAEGSGYGGGSSMVAQLMQVFEQAKAKLDAAALAYVKAGIGTYEGLTLTFIEKYKHNVLRPITYIHNVLGHTNWSTLYATPGYPDYPAGHPTNGGVLAVMLSDVFGSKFSFDLNFYDFLSRPARHYNSFEDLAQEMAIARVYSGIHYKPAVHAGVAVGKKVSQNILSKLRFLK
jgi:hypothetical protein